MATIKLLTAHWWNNGWGEISLSNTNNGGYISTIADGRNTIQPVTITPGANKKITQVTLSFYVTGDSYASTSDKKIIIYGKGYNSLDNAKGRGNTGVIGTEGNVEVSPNATGTTTSITITNLAITTETTIYILLYSNKRFQSATNGVYLQYWMKGTTPSVSVTEVNDTATVTLTKGNGIDSVTGAGTYTIGSSVTISADTSPGYTFSKWTNSSGTQISTSNPYTFNMSNNVSYTANATINSYKLTIDPNGGSYNNSTSKTESTVVYNNSVSINVPTRDGYMFNGWIWSGNESSFTMDQPAIGYAKANGSSVGSYTQTINSTEGFTTHKWSNISSPSTNTWNSITLSNYAVKANEKIVISGWIRIKKNTVNTQLNFYHGAEINDYQNAKLSLSNTDQRWQYFSFERTFSTATTAYLQVYTGPLKGLSGEIEFDLKGIAIARSDGSIIPTTFNMPVGNTTFTAKWTPNHVNIYENETNGFKPYDIYIYNGTSWDQYVPFIYDGSKWVPYN